MVKNKKTKIKKNGRGIEEIKATLAKLEPDKKSVKIDLFERDGCVKKKLVSQIDRTEELFEQEARRYDCCRLKPKTIDRRLTFKEIFQQLTIVNLATIILSPFLFLARKMRRSDERREEPDPFAAPKRKPTGIASFIVFSWLFILPVILFIYYQNISSIKTEISNRSGEAVAALEEGQSAVAAFDLSRAVASFDLAEDNFQQVIDEFNGLDFLAKGFLNLNPTTKKATTASMSLIEAGKSLAEVGKILAKSSNAILAETAPLAENWQEVVINRLTAINAALEIALPKIANAKSNLKVIDIQEVPADFAEKFVVAKQTLPVIESGLTNISEITDALLKVLGHYQWQRYLLVFQNSNELRATGGFMGSFALVDIDRGKIKNIEIPAGGTYDLQGSLTAMVASPKPLHLINPIWEFQDANWWPDFSTTAQKIAWFYEKAEGPSVDGVIALTTQVMEELLRIVGPIEMPQYNRIITAENFVEETQKIVELESRIVRMASSADNADLLGDVTAVAMRPKQFLVDLAPEILKRLFDLDQKDLPQLWLVLYDCLQKKQLQLYSFRPEVQKILSDFNWTGEFAAPVGSDYLAVINSNIGGGKTDGVITQTINHQAEITAAGKIIDTVTITKVHNGKKGDIFTGAQNNSYLRIYAPLGSKLINVAGFQGPDDSLFEEPPAAYHPDTDFLTLESEHQIDSALGTEIYNEGGKTVFAGWLLIKPGEQKTVVLEYELPFIIADLDSDGKKLYKLLVQKQAGTNTDSFSSKIINYTDLKVASASPVNTFQMALENKLENIIFTEKLNTDKNFEVEFK